MCSSLLAFFGILRFQNLHESANRLFLFCSVALVFDSKPLRMILTRIFYGVCDFSRGVPINLECVSTP